MRRRNFIGIKSGRLGWSTIHVAPSLPALGLDNVVTTRGLQIAGVTPVTSRDNFLMSGSSNLQLVIGGDVMINFRHDDLYYPVKRAGKAFKEIIEAFQMLWEALV